MSKLKMCCVTYELEPENSNLRRYTVTFTKDTVLVMSYELENGSYVSNAYAEVPQDVMEQLLALKPEFESSEVE